MATKSTTRLSLWASAIVGLCWLAADGAAQTQTVPVVTVSGFSASGYHPAPNHTRLKFQITGARAQPEAGNRVRVTEARVQSFRVSGEPEMIIIAPDCVYNPSQRTATSPGRLEVRTGDNRFSVEGEGFLWRGDESTLTISNQVRSVIHRSTNAVPDDARLPLIITARQFEFDRLNYRGVYRGDVHGDDPEMEFSCGALTASASTNSETFDLLLAEQDVVLVGKKDGLRATGDRAIYTRADERMVLSGRTAWNQGRQEGRADHVTLHRREQILELEGSVALRAPRESLGLGGFLLSATNAPSATVDDSPLVDLYAARFHHFPARSNLTVIEGGVRIVELTNQLTCDKLTVQSPSPTNQTAVAEGNVVISQGTQGHGIRSERAVYTKADDKMVFTGQPAWKLDRSDGRADRLTVHNATREIHAEGNVATKVTLGEQQGSLLDFFPAAGRPGEGPTVIEVFARELTAKDRQVVFQGDARAHQSPLTGAEPRLRGDTFEIRFAAETNRVESLRAVRNVVYEQGTPGLTNGPDAHRKLSTRLLTARTDPVSGGLADLMAEGDVRIEQAGSLATGERAAYSAARDSFEVTGQPTLTTPQMVITDARSLVWDKARNRFAATAPYRIRLESANLKQPLGRLEKR